MLQKIKLKQKKKRKKKRVHGSLSTRCLIARRDPLDNVNRERWSCGSKIILRSGLFEGRRKCGAFSKLVGWTVQFGIFRWTKPDGRTLRVWSCLANKVGQPSGKQGWTTESLVDKDLELFGGRGQMVES